jgi:predicted peptidase
MVRALQQGLCLLCLLFFIASCKKHGVNPASGKAITALNDLVETEPPIQVPILLRINDAFGGFYSAVPAHYTETTKKYPLLIFFHGAGQLGDGNGNLPYVLNDGVAHMISLKKFPPSFTVNGKNFSFIVLSPQFNRYPSNEEILSLINYAKVAYRIDPSRVYVSGLSMGGFVASNFAADYPTQVAAVVPISGELNIGDPRSANIAHAGLPVWVFHNNEDPSVNSGQATNFVQMINSFNPPVPARLTMFISTVHDAWSQATDPSYKENNMNIYEWMLQYTRE